MPPEVLLQSSRAKDTDAIVPAPERGIGDDDGWLWGDVLSRYSDDVELFSNPHMRVLVCLGKLRECLFSADVFLPEFLSETPKSFG